MPVALYASPYPKLHLSIDEKEQLYDTANELVSEAQAQYESYMWTKNSTLDMAQWSLVLKRGDIQVFHDRRPGAGTDNKDMHLMLTTGTVKGSLNEAMYGELNHSTDAMRIKTAYIKDTLVDNAVLETIVEPSEEEPFQSMTVRWFVKAQPLLARALVKNRDMVYLEATGMKKLSNGEEIGYHLMHTIHSPKTPKLPMYERSNLSICKIWRQLNSQRVQVFCSAYVEIDELSLIVPLAVRAVADALAAVESIVECAQLKKLAFLVQSLIIERQYDERGSAATGSCFVCGDESRSARRGVKSSCALCAKPTCRKCRVKRQIHSVTPDRQLLSLKMRFCIPCIASTAQLDALAVARDEVRTIEISRRLSSDMMKPLGVSSLSSTSSFRSHVDSFQSN